MVTTIMACISTYLCMSVFCVNYLELNAVELEPGFQFQAGGADRRNCGRSVELVDVNDLFFKVFLVHGWWWRWGRFFWLLFLFGLGFRCGWLLGRLFARFFLVLLLLFGVVGVGFDGLLLNGIVGGRRRGFHFSLRHIFL